MNKAIFKKICLLSVFCIAMISLALYLPMMCYGQGDCPDSLRVEVSPYQVNIDAGGAEHYVRVLTYTWYSNTAAAFVYINDNDDPIDPEDIILTRDSVGHLVVKIDLEALQEANLEVDTYHYLKIVVYLKDPADECIEGTGEIYIIGKKGK